VKLAKSQLLCMIGEFAWVGRIGVAAWVGKRSRWRWMWCRKQERQRWAAALAVGSQTPGVAAEGGTQTLPPLRIAASAVVQAEHSRPDPLQNYY